MELVAGYLEDVGRGAKPRQHVEILGCRVSRTTLAEAVALIEGWILEGPGKPRHIVATGFHGIWEAYKDPRLQRILNSADLFCPDGIAPVWLSRLQHDPLSHRVPGPDLMAAFLSKANTTGYSSFFLGDTRETLAELRRKVEREYPGHRVADCISPPFRDLTVEEDEEIVERINAAQADVLWVGLGMPKQEWWIVQHRERLRVPVVAGVGAAFRLVSGKVKRAPRWIGDHGFEWLWRFVMEPSKLWRRDLIEGPRFMAHALTACLLSRRQQIRSHAQ